MVDSVSGAAIGPKKAKKKKDEIDKQKVSKKEKKAVADLTLETGPGDTGPTAFQGPVAQLPPEGVQYIQQGGGKVPFDTTLNQMLNMPPGTDAMGAVGNQVPPEIAGGNIDPAVLASAEEAGAIPTGGTGVPGQEFQPLDVQPYPKLNFAQKLGYGLAAAVPFANLAAYPFWKGHQDKVSAMEGQDERTGDWFFKTMEEQPQAAQKLLNTPFIREALTRRYGIDTPEELEKMQDYASSIGMPLSQVAAGLATGKLTKTAGQGRGIGDVGTGAELAPPPGAIQSPLGYVTTVPQKLGQGERYVSPSGEILTTSQYEEQEKAFKKQYIEDNPGATDTDAALAYMYSHKGEPLFETTSGGNRLVITDKISGSREIIDGKSLQRSNIEVKEIWDGNEFKGWLMIDKDTQTSKEIWLREVMESLPPAELTNLQEDVLGWVKKNLPKSFYDVLSTIWDAGGKVAGKRKGGEGGPPSRFTNEAREIQEFDEMDALINGE